MSQQEPAVKAEVKQYTVKHPAFQQNELFDRVKLKDSYVDCPGGVASLTDKQVNSLTEAGYEVEPLDAPTQPPAEEPEQTTAESGEEVK